MQVLLFFVHLEGNMQFLHLNLVGHITNKMHMSKCLLMRTGVDGKQTLFDRVAGVNEMASYAVWCL